jgi:hypothetical protein
MTEPAVTVAYLHPGTLSAAFGYSTIRAMVYETCRTGRPPALIAQRCASGQLVEARNEAVSYFLATASEWLWCVDSDMGFDAATLELLLDSADPTERPIVGALCFGLKKADYDDATQAVTFRQFPTVYVWREKPDEVGFQVVTDYPRDTLAQVSATGAACFLAHRSVLERMRDKYGAEWFTPVTHPTGPTTFSEDLSFFIRAAAVDAPVYVNTRIRTSHDKGGVFLTEESWDLQQSQQGASDDTAAA